MTTCATVALTILASLPQNVRRVIGHDYDNDGMNHDGGETTHSPLVRVLAAAEARTEISTDDYDIACIQARDIRLRATGAVEAVRAFGVDAGQSYPDLLKFLSAAAHMNATTGCIDFMSVLDGGATDEDVVRARIRLVEEY